MSTPTAHNEVANIVISLRADGTASLFATCAGESGGVFHGYLQDHSVPTEARNLLGDLRSRLARSQQKDSAYASASQKQQIEALSNRARTGLLFAASIGRSEQFAFWQGQINALRALSDGAGAKLAAKDAALSGYEAPGYFQAAWAALPDRAERLSMAEVQQILAANGVEITADAVANGERDPVGQIEDRVVTTIHPDDEHAPAGIDCNNGSLHGDSSGELDAATVAQEGGAA